MEMTIDEDKCDTCIHSWTDECPLQKCWEHDYKYYEMHVKEKMDKKRLTYNVGEKHYCDYSTREIINRLAECEIMLEKIEQILKSLDDGEINYPQMTYYLREVIEDGSN